MSQPDAGYLVPLLGTRFSPDQPAEALQAYEDVTAALGMLAEAKRHITQMLVEYSMTVGRRTVSVPGGAQYERTGGPRSEYRDPYSMEQELLAAGMPEHRVREIVVTTVDRKVNGTQANAASKANTTYAEIIDRYRVQVEAPYRISPK